MMRNIMSFMYYINFLLDRIKSLQDPFTRRV